MGFLFRTNGLHSGQYLWISRADEGHLLNQMLVYGVFYCGSAHPNGAFAGERCEDADGPATGGPERERMATVQAPRS